MWITRSTIHEPQLLLLDEPRRAYFGRLLRVAVRAGTDPAALVTEVLGARAIAVRFSRESRTTMEDAFVSMVRAESRKLDGKG